MFLRLPAHFFLLRNPIMNELTNDGISSRFESSTVQVCSVGMSHSKGIE